MYRPDNIDFDIFVHVVFVLVVGNVKGWANYRLLQVMIIIKVTSNDDDDFDDIIGSINK